MGLRIEEIDSAAGIAGFVDAAFAINSQNPLWVPPLVSQERDLLTPARHPFWQTARRKLFIARDGERTAGRIAAIIDEKYNDYAGENCGAFGFFECLENREAADLLLNAAKSWLRDQGMSFMRGPLNPSANYTCGMLVDGFERPPALMMPWNPPYYPQLLEQWGLRKEEDLFAYVINKNSFRLENWLADEIRQLKTQGRFTCRPSSKATMQSDIRAMLEIYRLSWADNWGFSPLSDAEADRHVKELSSILDPSFFVLFFHNDEPAAGMVALPDMNPLLKRLNGKIGITAPWHYLRCRRRLRQGYRVMLFGILPQYRLSGLPLLLLDYMLELARSKKDFEWVEGSWVLEDNPAIDDLLEDFSGRLLKRYRIYRREILPC